MDGTSRSRLTTLAASLAIVTALYFGQTVLVPVAMAVLLSFLLGPLVARLERWKFGRLPAVALVIVLAVGLLGGVAWVVVLQVSDLADRLPSYSENLRDKVASVRGPSGSTMSKLLDAVGEIETELTSPAPGGRSGPLPAARPPPEAVPAARSRDSLWNSLGWLLEFLGSAGVVVILLFFMLLQREDVRDRFIRLVGGGRLRLTTQALDDASRRVSRYLVMQTVINGTYGLALGIGLSLLGLPSAALWGVLAAVLRFIPYLGPWIAAAMPLALALAISEGWRLPLLAGGLFLTLELVTNNLLEPWLYGARTGVSTVGLLVAAVFWTWLWGIAGLFLAVPLTVCLVVMGTYVPQLGFLSVILGDGPVLPPEARLYQRLLALDQEEASSILDAELKNKTVEEACDSLLAPAIALAERDRHDGELDERAASAVSQGLKGLVEEIQDREATLAANGGGGPAVEAGALEPLRVLCLPAHDEADEIAASLLAHVLGRAGARAEVVPVLTLAGTMMARVADVRPHAVLISAVPPQGLIRARYLCKRLVKQVPAPRIVIGLWTDAGDPERARERLRCAGDIHVVSTFAAARRKIQELAAAVRLPGPREPAPRTPSRRTEEPAPDPL